MSGTTDKDHQFHPFCLVISKFEEAEDYGYMFKTLKSLIYEVFNHIYEPEILVGDSAAAITHGFELAFEKLVKRIVCWIHMLRAVDTHLRLVIISLLLLIISNSILLTNLTNLLLGRLMLHTSS